MNLIEKYNIPGPRYTSYPTVPMWDVESFSREKWTEKVAESFTLYNKADGVSIYIHLPYCESLCTYCGCNTRITVNHLVELPYISALLKEWNMYKRIFGKSPLIKQIHLGGGTPTFFSPENLFLLMDGILNEAVISEGAEFSFEGHPVNTSREHLDVLYNVGFRRVSFGIQDFDLKVQKAINRFQTFEQVETVTRWAREIGYTSVNFDLIYGLPFQTEACIEDTFKKTIALMPDRIAFYSYAHVPWLKPGQRQFTEKDLPEGEGKRALYELGRSLLNQVGYKEIGMDHFALPNDELFSSIENKTIHRNFMGYTTQKSAVSIGLGVSAISDIQTAFAQNGKTVEVYLNDVNSGNLPVFKGHILSTEDLVMRKHILNIICQYETDWKLEEDQSDGVEDALDELHEMEKDGLIEVGVQYLKVTPKGKPFVRNVCMAFDRRLKGHKGTNAKFSKVV